MTDREFKYKKFTENQLNFGQFVFDFENPARDSFLSTFSIFKNQEIIFNSDYIINEDLKIRIKTISNNKRFKINEDQLQKYITVEIIFGNLVLSTEDFLYIISNQLWVVEDIIPDIES